MTAIISREISALAKLKLQLTNQLMILLTQQSTIKPSTVNAVIIMLSIQSTVLFPVLIQAEKALLAPTEALLCLRQLRKVQHTIL